MKQLREFWKGYGEVNTWLEEQKEIRVVQIQPLFIPGYGVVYIVEYEIANAFIEKISSKK
jgi:hypothetical protein